MTNRTAVRNGTVAVDEYGADSFGMLTWLGKGRPVAEPTRVEGDDVGNLAGCEFAAILKPEPVSRQLRHPLDGPG